MCEDPLMYTKEDRLKNSHYAQAICAVVADLKKLTIPAVVGRSEQFCECDGVQDLIAGTGECRKCGGQCTY